MTAVTARGEQAAAMSTQTVRTFFIATFALSWGAGMLFTAFSTQVEGTRDECRATSQRATIPGA